MCYNDCYRYLWFAMVKTNIIIASIIIIITSLIINSDDTHYSAYHYDWKKENNIINGYHHNNNGTQNNGPLMIVMIVIVNYGSLWFLAKPKEIIWRFPKIGVPLNHLFLFGMFHEINHLFTIQLWGPPFQETFNVGPPSYKMVYEPN